MNNSVIDPAGHCAHATVKRQVMEDNGRVYAEQWRCPDCGMEFVPMPSFFPSGPITVMEPHATLRDQFAMAAMLADGIQSAVIAAGYLAQGKYFSGEQPKIADGAKEYFETADAMMKAREEKDAKVV